jgi:hypothetical protein
MVLAVTSSVAPARLEMPPVRIIGWFGPEILNVLLVHSS